tara:strand:+ start:7205 stop:8119 length:915 start_codon:yes stop_codon:yes gene_type:complete
MKLRNSTNLIKPTIATIGTFDGVHKGHKALINHLIDLARQFDQTPVVIVFEETPKNFFLSKKIRSLCTVSEREKLLNSLGIENIISLRFDKNIQKLSSDEFISELVEKIGIKTFVLGSDSKIGYDQSGYEDLKNNYPNIKFIKFLPKKNKGKIISSTLVKEAIEKGNCEETKELLGRFYNINGKVTKGNNLGEKLGFPTANLIPSSKLVIPKDGIYASIVEYNDKKYYAATSIGKRPTFEKNGQRIIETFILEFNKNIYHKKINVHLVSKIRDEQKFNSQKELIEKMNEDIKNIKLILDKKNLL